MDTKQLLAKVRQARQGTVDLEDGMSVTFIRPPEADFNTLLKSHADGESTWEVGLPQVKKYVIGWNGFKESFFLGAGVGSDDEVPFDAELWSEIIDDRGEWVGKIARKILDAVVGYINRKAEDSGNSAPG